MKRILLVLTGLAAAGFAMSAGCGDCHADMADSLVKTPHAVLHNEDKQLLSCTQCHGAGETHLLNPFAGGVVAFDGESAPRKNEACGSCHSDAHVAGNSAHEVAGVACSDCHSVHGLPAGSAAPPAGFEKLDATSATCANCHEDVLAGFAFSKHHRLAENSVTCVDCHDPHAERRSPLGSESNQQVCVKCHTDKAGPFIFEHDAGMVDGCLACHAPHGSANRHLLNHQAVGELCFSCHAALPQFHLGFAPSGPPRFGGDTVCTNCHVTVHGSNLDSAFLK
jgi:DmsE family decaheme c-type cytochrome